MMMEDDIIELHRALQEARGLDNRSERYKMHMAKVQDIRDLSELDDGRSNGQSCYDKGNRCQH